MFGRWDRRGTDITDVRILLFCDISLRMMEISLINKEKILSHKSWKCYSKIGNFRGRANKDLKREDEVPPAKYTCQDNWWYGNIRLQKDYKNYFACGSVEKERVRVNGPNWWKFKCRCKLNLPSSLQLPQVDNSIQGTAKRTLFRSVAPNHTDSSLAGKKKSKQVSCLCMRLRDEYILQSMVKYIFT